MALKLDLDLRCGLKATERHFADIVEMRQRCSTVVWLGSGRGQGREDSLIEF